MHSFMRLLLKITIHDIKITVVPKTFNIYIKQTTSWCNYMFLHKRNIDVDLCDEMTSHNNAATETTDIAEIATSNGD